MTQAAINGIIDVASRHSVDETAAKLEGLLRTKSITLFASIDHAAEAARAGMKLRPTKLLIFGNPKAGTPLMLAAPRAALDLPLKILVWEDDRGRVWVSYDSPDYLQKRHGFPQALVANIEAVTVLAAKVAE